MIETIVVARPTDVMPVDAAQMVAAQRGNGVPYALVHHQVPLVGRHRPLQEQCGDVVVSLWVAYQSIGLPIAAATDRDQQAAVKRLMLDLQPALRGESPPTGSLWVPGTGGEQS